ncbi:MAG: hypothetical protein J2P21_23370 [Chloracidobacterium sp.]|nr:hypothetical protein [Chloracidobacterium sp.]
MRNRKLTPIIGGRTVKRATQGEGVAIIEFEDGSILKIKIGAPFNETVAGKKVKAVRQKATEFNLDFYDGASAVIILAAETSSVILRDKAGSMEYAD